MQPNQFPFQQDLERQVGGKLHLKINDNRHTMLSVKWDPFCTKVSLNKFFLQAPPDVIQALASYIKGKKKTLDPAVKAFIHHSLSSVDFKHLLNDKTLITKGSVYDLEAIFEEIQRTYFDNGLGHINLTWFGSEQKVNRSRLTFGLYHHHLNLIKVNRILDNTFVPDYVISFVMYHEMLHRAFPSYVDDKGIHRIHTREFKDHELRFKEYDLAQKWIKEHKEELFAD